jgi:hypothetical protein
MSPDDFEQHLQHQPLRQVPAQWRGEILSAIRQAAARDPVTRHTPHAPRGRSALSTLNHQLSTLLWPSPVAWAGLAAVWLVILAFNFGAGAASVPMAKGHPQLAPQFFLGFQEQERLLAELIGPRETPSAEPPRRVTPKPRSEATPQTACV